MERSASADPGTAATCCRRAVQKRSVMTDGAKNLMLARGEKSVWDKPGFGATLSTYDQERWMTAAWASVLAMIGARRGGFTGGLLAMAGVALTVRAAMGRRDLPRAPRLHRTQPRRIAAGARRTW